MTFTPTARTTFTVGSALGVQGSFAVIDVNDQPWTYPIAWGDGKAKRTGHHVARGAPNQLSDIRKHRYLPPEADRQGQGREIHEPQPRLR